MGTVRMGAPERLVEALQRACGIRTFIETGTWQGGTASWAATRFDRVITIEASRPIHERALVVLKSFSNVEPVLGDTRAELARVLPGIEGPALFWLDAHWSGGESAGADDECPVLAELEAVLGAPPGHVVLVDDARLFLAPPPPPHRVDQWPGLRDIVAVVAARRPEAYLVVVEDVIVIAPPRARAAVVQYCRDVATDEQRARAIASRGGPLRRSARLLAGAARVMFGGG